MNFLAVERHHHVNIIVDVDRSVAIQVFRCSDKCIDLEDSELCIAVEQGDDVLP